MCYEASTLLIKADLAWKAEHVRPQRAQTLLLLVLKMAQVASHQLPSQPLHKYISFSLLRLQCYQIIRKNKIISLSMK